MSSGSKHTAVALAVLLATVAAVWRLALAPTQRHDAAPVHLAVAPSEEAPDYLPAAPDRLRVCADPNNMPFTNDRGEGFENRIAEVAARDLGRTLTYVWQPQRRGFIRTTLDAGACDVVMSVPAHYGRVLTTAPYYRSTFVFVTRRADRLALASLDDPRLRRLQIGIPVVGDDYQNPPAAAALAARGVVDNVRGFSVYGDYSRPDPPRALIDAVARGAIDVAIAWGPLAGYFAGRAAVPLELTPVTPAHDRSGQRFVFAIAMGVRHGDVALARALDGVLRRRDREINAVLAEYGVPLAGPAHSDATVLASRRTP